MRRSRTRGARCSATTSASRSAARAACWPPATARATSVERATAAGYASDPALPFFLERYADAYRLELDAFVRRLHGETADIVSGGDGVRALEIADACDRSLRTRATVLLETRA